MFALSPHPVRTGAGSNAGCARCCTSAHSLAARARQRCGIVCVVTATTDGFECALTAELHLLEGRCEPMSERGASTATAPAAGKAREQDVSCLSQCCSSPCVVREAAASRSVANRPPANRPPGTEGPALHIQPRSGRHHPSQGLTDCRAWSQATWAVRGNEIAAQWGASNKSAGSEAVAVPGNEMAAQSGASKKSAGSEAVRL